MPRHKTSFDQRIRSTIPIELCTVISPNNVKQCGVNFGEFVALINAKRDIIKSLVLVDASYLNRYYKERYANFNNEAMLFEWRNAHLEYLQQLQVPYRVASWYELIKEQQFSEKHKALLERYATDPHLREVVDSLALKFTHLGTFQQCRGYLLEECTGALLINGYLTYPGELNAAIKYVLKENANKLYFVAYTIRKKHSMQQLPQQFLLRAKSSFFVMQQQECQATNRAVVAYYMENERGASLSHLRTDLSSTKACTPLVVQISPDEAERAEDKKEPLA